MDARGEWCASERLSRHVLSDNADFTVVGVVGTQGAGKSALMGHLAGFPAFGGATARDPRVSSTPASASSSRTKTTTPTPQPQPPFPVGTADVPFGGGDGPTTRTVDVRVTPDRLILLDAPPVLSPALLRRRPATAAATAADDARRRDARLARFLADACDVILVVADGPDDLRAATIIAEATSKRSDATNPTAPPSSSSLSVRPSSPRLALVRNRVPRWYRDARDAETRARADAAFRIAAGGASTSASESESESSRATRWRVVEMPDADEPDAAEATEEALAALTDAAVSAGAARRLEEREGGAAATERGWLRRAERAWNQPRDRQERTRTREEDARTTRVRSS